MRPLLLGLALLICSGCEDNPQPTNVLIYDKNLKTSWICPKAQTTLRVSENWVQLEDKYRNRFLINGYFVYVSIAQPLDEFIQAHREEFNIKASNP